MGQLERSGPSRNAHRSRPPTPPWREKLKVWVRSGGRCAVCNRYLLESDITLRPVALGELAHNRAASDGGPRADPDLHFRERNKADNLLLLCGAHHPDVDNAAQLDLLTIEQLAEIKRVHEQKISLATSRVGGQRTAVLRVQGDVRGAPVEIGVEEAAAAVIKSTTRFPELPFSFDRQGVEIDLRGIPGEADCTPAYFEAAKQQIDQVLAGRFCPAVENGEVEHVSVMALARLPILVYLGSRLDDTIPTDVYQRQRNGQTWAWGDDRDDDPKFHFRQHRPATGEPTPSEAVVIVNASGTVHAAELPEDLREMACYVLEPTHATPHPDTVRSRAVRDSAEAAIRGLLAHLEVQHKTVRKLHLVAAVPVSIAVTLGRAVGWGIQPGLVVYERRGESYVPAMEVIQP